jgi:pilus assembly protein Flp/PilA
MVRLIRDLCANRRGVTLIEYGLVAGLVSMVAVAALANIGTALTSLYGSISSSLATA